MTQDPVDGPSDPAHRRLDAMLPELGDEERDQSFGVGAPRRADKGS